MKLLEKLKNLPKIALLSAAVLSAGCATPWQTVREEHRPTGIERTVIINETPKNIEEIEFKISEPYMEDGEHEIQVDESLVEVNSQVRTIGTEKGFRKFLIEERKVPPFPPMTLAGGMLGFTGGLVPGLLTEDDEKDNLFPIDDSGDILSIIGGIVGLVGGIYLGYKVDESLFTTETRRITTNEITQKLAPSRTTERVPGDKVVIYQDKPASDISVKFTGEGRDKMYVTDSEGELNLSHFLDSLNPSYFFGNYTNIELEDRIEKIPLIRQIKPNTLETLMGDLIRAVSPKDVRLTVSTEEESSEEYAIKNDSRTFNIEGSQITDESIYGIVRQFVDEEINSHIKSLTFVVKDNISHIPIDGSNFEFKLNAPRKEDLAGEYFIQELKDYAQRHIKDYLEGNAIIERVPNLVSFDIYSPSKIQLEVTNPNYNFVLGVIDLDDKDVEKNVYMVDKGSKIRVQGADDERGRIE